MAPSKVTFVVKEAKSDKLAGSVVKEVLFSGEPAGETIVDVNIPVKNCRFWSPENPFLYNLTVTTEGDEYQTRFRDA